MRERGWLLQGCRVCDYDFGWYKVAWFLTKIFFSLTIFSYLEIPTKPKRSQRSFIMAANNCGKEQGFKSQSVFLFSSHLFTKRIDFLIVCCPLLRLEANCPVNHLYYLCSSLQVFAAAALAAVLVWARSLDKEDFQSSAVCHLFPVFRSAF